MFVYRYLLFGLERQSKSPLWPHFLDLLLEKRDGVEAAMSMWLEVLLLGVVPRLAAR
jgi:hypothetical protein